MEARDMPETQQRPFALRDNTVYVGKKHVMSYVRAVVSKFNQAGISSVKIKARGQAISRAVDVTQIVKNRFLPSLKISDFNVETEDLESEDGSMKKVSSVTLTVSK